VSGRLDRDVSVVTSFYSLCITAGDGRHNASVQLNVTLIPDDQQDSLGAVEFSRPFYVLDVPEDAGLGVTVGRVQASVVGDSSTSSGLTYVITSRWASSVFQLNATYGVLTLASALDYETVSDILGNM